MKRKGLNALEYLKEREKAKKYWKWRSADEIPLDEKQRKTALENACPNCHAIRSALEIQKGICDNCG